MPLMTEDARHGRHRLSTAAPRARRHDFLDRGVGWPCRHDRGRPMAVHHRRDLRHFRRDRPDRRSRSSGNLPLIVIYAFAMSLVFSAPVTMVATRLVGDALWLQNPVASAGSAVGVLWLVAVPAAVGLTLVQLSSGCPLGRPGARLHDHGGLRHLGRHRFLRRRA